MYKALYISPMIPSYDLAKTGHFFKDVLEFDEVFNTGTYAIYVKDKLTIHLINAGEDIGQMEFYLEVDDIANVWKSISAKITTLKHRPPFDREYNMREIHIEIPETKTLMFIGQVLG